MECGAVPIASHFYALSLDDSIPYERAIGTRAGLILLGMCDEVWAFGNNFTEGMAQEIAEAYKLGIPVVHIADEQVYKKLEMEVDSHEQIDRIEQNTTHII